MHWTRLCRYAWAGPTTMVGLAAVGLSLMTGGQARIVDGVIEAHGGFARFALRHLTPLPGGAAAMTLGHVIIGQDAATLDFTRTHEHVHVRQCERWGPLFLPAYLGASAVLWLMRRDAYRENPFERDAYGQADA